MNYYDHCTEQNFPIPKEPVIFSKFASSIVSNGEPLPLDEELTQEKALILNKQAVFTLIRLPDF